MNLNLAHTGLFLAIAALLAPAPVRAQDASTADAVPPQPQAQESATELDAVQVRGAYIPQPMLTSSAVMTHVSREDLDRQGDSTAADALVRVAGLAVDQGKYVYVRGLNERYSSALLNNSPLPSPEPLKRVVPLDLFPTNVLDTVEVVKTYSARYPGEFGGGTINLTSAVVPDQPFLKLKIGMGGNSETTGQPGLTHYGGGASDFFGFDDGTRKMPGELQDALATGNRVTPGPDFTDAEVKRIAMSFTNAPLNLLQTTDHVDPDYEYEITAGNAFDVGETSRLGLVATASLKNRWRTQVGVQQDGAVEAGSMAVQSDYDFLSTTNNATVNGLVGATLQTENHTIGLMTMYVHDTDKETRSTEGYSLLTGDNIRDDVTRWYERELINTQATGKHVFGEFRDLTIDWRAGHSRASLDAPYDKGFRWREDAYGNWFHDASQAQNYTRFSQVDERVDSAGVDAAWRLPVEMDLYLNFGGAWSDTERNAVSREFRLLSLGNLPFQYRYLRPDFLLSDYVISQGYLTLRETTGGTGAAAYDGRLETSALYVEAESQLNDYLRATLGVRYEDATQSVDPIDLFDQGQPLPTAAPLENDYFLPAATLTWNFADNQQLRFGASKTIARPQFRELAPQQYLDLDSDRLVIGNPFLVDSELVNLDARYEWYFDRGEYFSAGVFYKDIDKPVETVLNGRTGSSWQQSFINAPGAVVYGLELDFRQYYGSPFEWTGDSRFFVAANYTWSDSEVQVDDDDVAYTLAGNGNPQPASELVMDGSRLQGQSEHLANLQLGIESLSTGSQATLLVGYASERINARGINGFDPATGQITVVQPDYVQEPGTTVDLVLNKFFNLWDVDMEISFEARNILGAEYQEVQSYGGGTADVMRYDLGTSYMLSLSASF